MCQLLSALCPRNSRELCARNSIDRKGEPVTEYPPHHATTALGRSASAERRSASAEYENNSQMENKMNNNALLRSIRDALVLDEATMIQIFKEAGREIGQSAVTGFLKTEEEDNYIPCANPIMGFFLDGLIIHYRGRKEGNPPQAAHPVTELSNNTILKKLRIAMDLKEEDVVDILTLGGVIMKKHEITALFRKEGHKHYHVCDDQLLRSFIKGVALRAKG